ncbi:MULTISPECIES: hypothetical protein [Pseudomonas]|uniref:Lipoprotein n=1 Tax=Pseudomonas helleri TaxID=1608996 RepID=A0A7X2C419_9PSED|nr:MULTISPECIES: hypothetical protein [Pseudomonas]MQT51939.1 hypothetical protein [Pseudomonas sp. FSL R10-2398]MQT90048.1 hypothetical protein [Pseudomonas helleri]
MELTKALALSSLLIISGCGTTWDIISVETSASATSGFSREENKEKIKALIADPETDLDARVYAHYSYAALSLGYLATSNTAYRYYSREDQRNGFNLIDIDQKLFQSNGNRMEAKQSLEYVTQNLSNLKGSALISAGESQKKLVYAFYFLALIEEADGNYETAKKLLERFEQSGFTTREGMRLAEIAKSDIQNKVDRISEEKERQARVERQRALDLEAHAQQKLARKIAAETRATPSVDQEATGTPMSNEKYVAALKKQYGSRISYNSQAVFLTVSTFNIDCRTKDGRYLPLENILLARIREMNNEKMWLESIADSRDNQVRIYDYLKSQDGSVTEPQVSIEINSWGELKSHGFRTEAILNACYGSYGPIWVRK